MPGSKNYENCVANSGAKSYKPPCQIPLSLPLSTAKQLGPGVIVLACQARRFAEDTFWCRDCGRVLCDTHRYQHTCERLDALKAKNDSWSSSDLDLEMVPLGGQIGTIGNWGTPSHPVTRM